MKQLILFFAFLSFVGTCDAQVIKKKDDKSRTVPIRTIPGRRVPVQIQTESKTIPVLENKSAIDAKRANTIARNLKYFKSAKAGQTNSQGGERELKVMSQGFDAADNTSVTPSSSPRTTNGLMCSDERINTNLTSSDFKAFSLTGAPDWLKPGIILKGSDLVNGYETIEEKYNRSPITLATTSNKARTRTVTIANPKNKSSITSAESDLKSQDNARMGAMVDYSSYEVHSEQELNFKLTGKYSMGFGAFSARLGVSTQTSKKEHYYLMEFNQIVFSIEVDGVDKQNVFPDNPEVATDNYVYISKVNYGRKAYVMFKSEESLQDIKVSADIGSRTGYGKMDVKSALDYLQNDKKVEIKAVYYGGGMNSVKASISALERREISVKDFLNASADFAPYLAFPVSYELKNLDNERVGMQSRSMQTVTTCVPVKTLKLKVTLAEIQSETTSDRDKYADFTVIQKVLYKAKGSHKTAADSRYNKYGGDCKPGGSTTHWPGSVALICGDVNKQIHVMEGKIRNKTRTASGSNINNYVVFHITPEEANDPDAEFMIRTYVRENNSSNDIRLNYDDEITQVAIKDVLSTLKGIRTLRKDGGYPYDGAVYSNMQFDHFGGLKMPLTRVKNDDKVVLEGAIRARNRGSSLTDKAFLWIRFELID